MHPPRVVLYIPPSPTEAHDIPPSPHGCCPPRELFDRCRSPGRAPLGALLDHCALGGLLPSPVGGSGLLHSGLLRLRSLTLRSRLALVSSTPPVRLVGSGLVGSGLLESRPRGDQAPLLRPCSERPCSSALPAPCSTASSSVLLPAAPLVYYHLCLRLSVHSRPACSLVRSLVPPAACGPFDRRVLTETCTVEPVCKRSLSQPGALTQPLNAGPRWTRNDLMRLARPEPLHLTVEHCLSQRRALAQPECVTHGSRPVSRRSRVGLTPVTVSNLLTRLTD